MILEIIMPGRTWPGDTYKTVIKCSRCGQKHVALLFRPISDTSSQATHEATCPKTKKAVYIRAT